jgi:DNA-binding PadR family transcriptional regulator
MQAGAADRKLIGSSPLRGAVLALLVTEEGQQLGGYRLGTLIERRLGPGWRVTRQSVYGTLERLEEDGLISCTFAAGSSGGEGQRLYSATERAHRAVDLWMDAPVVREPVRVELQAKIAVSRPQDATRLLRALDGYEQECFALLGKTQEAEVPMGSWTGVAMNLTRAAVDESVQADLRWIALARRWIEEFLARQSGV